MNNGGTIRKGFTLVEILVALAIFMLILTIIVVPLNLATNLLHVGKMEINLRSTSQTIITRMQDDLTHAVYVFPNDVVPNVTINSAGLALSPYNGGSTSAPYFDGDPCDNNRVSNLARIDMLLPVTNDHDGIFAPVTPLYYIVTYYARRLDVTQQYQPIENPIVLFRAQVPFRGDPTNPAYMIDSSGNAVQPAVSGEIYPSGAALNANVFDGRYTHLSDCGANSGAVNTSAKWLTQSDDGEPNLEPLTEGSAKAFTLYGSHTSVLEKGMGLNTRAAFSNPPSNYERPDSSFICADISGNGIINQVTIKLSLYLEDSMKAHSAKKYALSQVVNLPNVRSIPNIH